MSISYNRHWKYKIIEEVVIIILKQVKSLIVKQTNVDIYQYKHGEIAGTQTLKYFGLFSKIKPFNDFEIKDGTITIPNAVNMYTKYAIHTNCE